MFELEHVKKELNEMTAVDVETGIVTIANANVDIYQRLGKYKIVQKHR